MNRNHQSFDSKIEGTYLTDTLNKLSKQYEITKWDLGASVSSDSSVQVDQGQAKQMKSSQRSSITLRVWNKESLVGVTSTSDLTERGLSKAIEGAYQASMYGNPNDVPCFSPLAKEIIQEPNNEISEPVGIKRLLSTLIKAEAETIKSHKSIKNVPYNGIAESNYQRLYINSDGAHRFIRRSQSSIYLYARAEEDGRKPRSSGAVRVSNSSKELDVSGCIEEAVFRTTSHLNYRPIDTDKYLVCFSPEAVLDLIGAFSSIFNARNVLDGISISKADSLGKQISVPNLTLYDNALHKANIGASTFDGEGTPTSKLCLIKKGILVNFMHSEATARHFGVKPTGHAGLGAKVSVGPEWFEIEKTPSKTNEGSINLNHKTSLKTFVLVEGLNAMHSGVKASQGSFSLPFDGWLVDNGEKISIEAATIAGDITNILKNIIFIEDEQVTTHQGVSPHIWVGDLSITGEA